MGMPHLRPQKAKVSAGLRARITNEARIASSLWLDDNANEVYLRDVRYVKGEKTECVGRFRPLERRYVGRIARRTLYMALGGQLRSMTRSAGLTASIRSMVTEQHSGSAMILKSC